MEKFMEIGAYLIERETLDAEEIRLIMNNEKLPPLQNGKKNAAEEKEGAEAEAPEEREY
jgi:hypothetical protein